MERVKRGCLLGELSDSRTSAWRKLSEFRNGVFSAKFLIPQRRLLPSAPRLLWKEVMTLIVPITFVTFAFVPWKVVCSSRPATL